MAGDLEQIRAIERAALAAWPALEERNLAGWRLRCSQGVTRRANSVWPNELEAGAPAASVSERIRLVEEHYGARGLPARYQICPAALPGDLDGALAAQGYAAVAATDVMVAPLARIQVELAARLGSWRVTLQEEASDQWLSLYGAVESVPAVEMQTRRAIMQGIAPRAAYAVAWAGKEAAAVGSVVCSGPYAGLFNLGTLPAWRRRGAATAVMAGLLQWAGDQGASETYLQVMAQNGPAKALYARLGFHGLYAYHYRELRATRQQLAASQIPDGQR